LAFLLDTCIAINLRDNRGNTVANVTALPMRPAISAISKVELEGGVYANPELTDARRRALDALLRRLPVLDFTSAMAAAYGQIVAESGFSRRKALDRMIAATALANDFTLITSNGEDFADIKDLKLEIWSL
jgi:tRNA(fMet)-specific endonuclease VapC